MQQAEHMTTVMFRGETRTLMTKLCPFQEFETNLLSQLNITSYIAIKYQDSEKDWIVVGCDDDVKDALSTLEIILQVIERAAPSDERDIKRNLVPTKTSVPKKSSVLKRRANDAIGASSASGSRGIQPRDKLFNACEVDNVASSKAAPTLRFSVPDTAEMDAELLAAHQRRLQNRAYESRAVRIDRFYQTTSAMDPVAANDSPHQRKARVRWGAGGRGQGEVAHDPAIARAAKASTAADLPSSTAQPADKPPPTPTPAPRPYYDAVAAAPPVRARSLAVAAPAGRGWRAGEPLVGVGLLLKTSAPYLVLDGSVLRDSRGVLQGCSGYSNPVAIQANDWCAAAAAVMRQPAPVLSARLSLAIFAAASRAEPPLPAKVCRARQTVAVS